MCIRVILCLVVILMPPMSAYTLDSPSETNTPYIARWYGSRSAAVSLRFDDNHESHLENAIPIMNRFGLKGTFMVSPGRSSFEKHREQWLEQVPSMGHELGNHTMHHRGAGSLSEAMYEIGEAARIIREATGQPEGLLVFASGGGKYWGGNRWSSADENYRQIPGTLNMIDLYDGNHPYVNVTREVAPAKLMGYVDAAEESGLYQAFTFHNVGSPTFRDLIRRVIRGTNLSYPVEHFSRFMENLSHRSDRVWVASVGDILKYQAQFRSAVIEDLIDRGESVSFRLSISTDPKLYDHPLTLVLPRAGTDDLRIYQDGSPLKIRSGKDGTVSVDLIPKNSVIRAVGL